MSYTVTEATVVFPDKKAASSFSSGYASKKPCAHIDCDLEGGYERSIWIPVRVARLYVKNRPDLPCAWDDFREAVQLRQPAIDFAVARATEYRFLDENRFCSYFIEERKRRGWGQRKIEVELKRRHVVLDDIPGYPEAYFAVDDDLARASALLAKRRVPEVRKRGVCRVNVHVLRPCRSPLDWRRAGCVYLTVVAVQRRINTVICFVICAHL